MFSVARRRWIRKQQSSLLLVLIGAFVIIGLSATAIFHYVEAYHARLNAPVPLPHDPNLGVKAFATEFFTDNDAAELLPIIECESNFRHYETDGSVLKNREGSSAIGIAQILTSKHPDPKVLTRYNRNHNTELAVTDFDLTTLRSNLGYALVLYEVRGTRDWECAKH